mgnify:CR=1 FL=1
MTRQTRIRLFSLLVLLGVLAGVLATPDTENAYAAPCCSTCDYRESACLQGTLYPECGGDPGKLAATSTVVPPICTAPASVQEAASPATVSNASAAQIIRLSSTPWAGMSPP